MQVEKFERSTQVTMHMHHKPSRKRALICKCKAAGAINVAFDCFSQPKRQCCISNRTIHQRIGVIEPTPLCGTAAPQVSQILWCVYRSMTRGTLRFKKPSSSSVIARYEAMHVILSLTVPESTTRALFQLRSASSSKLSTSE